MSLLLVASCTCILPFLNLLALECLRPVPFAVDPNLMKASSSLSGFPAKDGLIIEDDVSAAWCATEENEEQWLEVDLQEDKDVMAVALQGRYHHSWVTTFYIQYSMDGNTWYCYGSGTGHKVMVLDVINFSWK